MRGGSVARVKHNSAKCETYFPCIRYVYIMYVRGDVFAVCIHFNSKLNNDVNKKRILKTIIISMVPSFF